MDYSLFSISYLVRNDLADFLQTKLPPSKEQSIKYFRCCSKTNLLYLALESKSEKSFDILLNHIRNYDVIGDFSYLELFRNSIRNFSQHSNRYYIDRIIEAILNYNETHGEIGFTYFRSLLSNALRIRYDIKSTKETKKLNEDLQLDLFKSIINHPKFNFEKFIETSDFNCKSVEVWKIIKEKVIENGIDINKFLDLYISKQLICGSGTINHGPSTSNLVKVLTKEELQMEVKIYNVPMTIEEAILMTRQVGEDFKIKLTEEKEERLIEIFESLKETKYSSTYFTINMFITPLVFRNYHPPTYTIFNSTFSTKLPKVIQHFTNSSSKKFLKHLVDNVSIKIDEISDSSQKTQALENITYLKTLLS